MDDPLSAVDANTCEILFGQGIKYLKQAGKTVILVTHQTHLLSEVDLIVVLEKDGTIKSCCTYEQLSSHGVDLDKLVMQNDVEVSDEVSQCESESNDVRFRSSSNTTTTTTTTRVRSSSVPTRDRSSSKSESKKRESNKGVLITEEERKEGLIPKEVYWWFARAGGLHLVYIIFFLCLASKCSILVATFVLAAWGNANTGIIPLTPSQNLYWLGTYSWLLLLGLGLVTLRTLAAAIHGVRGGYMFHQAMIARVLRSPVSFFDVTPSGRILNRFSGDLQLADQGLTALIVIVVTLFADVIASMVAVSIATNGAFVPLFIPLCYFYYLIQKYYRKSNTEVRRLVAISRSPVFTEISQTISGVTSLQAFGRTIEFVKRLEDKTDEFLALNYVKAKLNCWLCVRNDALGASVSFFIVCLAASTTNFMRAEVMAVALTYSFVIPVLFGVIFNLAAEIEGMMSAIERIKEYAETVPVEEGREVKDINDGHITTSSSSSFCSCLSGHSGSVNKSKLSVQVPTDWPSKGQIRVVDLHMRYRDGPLVLKGCEFEISSGERVGIAGRTGSGKSSLLAALFKIVKPESGAIFIDGIDIATVDIATLRSRLTIIPQDPTMFCASIRYNLDPFNAFTDIELLDALDAVDLKDVVLAMPGGLLADVADGGENLSMGQRQLICFARALLRKPRIVVLDEATASIDAIADGKIQQMLIERLKGCTVLTIAHRLHTIINSDRILMFDSGKVIENGTPESLMEMKNGVFSSMWKTYETSHA